MTSSDALTEQAILDGTCAVVVTYGHRLAFVEQVLHAAFQAAAGHVILVDNGTEQGVASSLKSCAAAWGADRVTSIRLEHNGGSAAGFAAGIAAAAQRAQTRHIWTLDDDTVALPDALKALARTWQLMGANPSNCLASFRQDKRTYVKLVNKNKPNAIQPNSFFGFSAQAPFQKKNVAVWQKDGLECRSMEMGAYGGLWFHKDWVQRIGLPDQRFFLYFDDYNYTLRITHQGGALWMCRNSVLTDLEQSWTQTSSCLHPWLQEQEGMRRPYFALRNRVVIEQNSIDCQPVYYLNMVLFLIVKVLCRTPGSLVCHALHPLRMMRRWRVLLGAIQDGLSGNFENKILK
ncbi:glycosyltransferase [Acetobacter orleanensis]|nr:glycosyltransferase [Acetobacter orleanensis]KXV62628.1 glycosyl transferase [Acetobacter orleanensis]PCD80178.1 glycosyl transferase [Acetobacter orleanensis]GBR29767.1 glycosyltransferase [Acetobacter orleanensis NRIC 0473]